MRYSAHYNRSSSKPQHQQQRIVWIVQLYNKWNRLRRDRARSKMKKRNEKMSEILNNAGMRWPTLYTLTRPDSTKKQQLAPIFIYSKVNLS